MDGDTGADEDADATVDADAGFEAHLRVGGVTVDGEDAALLRAVDEHRSLNAAAGALGRSYSRAHRRVTDLEEALGPLVERRRGGVEGGGSRLTDGARALLARFDRLQAALAGTADVAETVLEGTVRERTGDLAEVETPAGPVRALLADRDGPTGEGARVQVTLRADAVTLHAPASAPPATDTSARNRFEGRVERVVPGDGIARVAVDVGTATPLWVLVTAESLEKLDLAPGREVVATVKATATHATPL
jgi:molybdate transport system regulatory protein